MPIPSKADSNVPFLPGRSRYSVVTSHGDTWVYHRGTLDGTAPKVASTPAGDYADPALMEAGRAEWLSLTNGGLFTLIGNQMKSLVCSAIDNSGATLTLVRKNGTLSRAMPNVFPFVIATGEYIKAVGGTAVGLLLRIEDQTTL